AIDAFDSRAEALALAAVKHGIDNGSQCAAYPALWDLGAILGPVSFHQARARILGMDGKPLLAPEIDDFRVDLFGGLIDHQPANVTVSHDRHTLRLRQNAFGGRATLLALLVLRVLAECSRALGCAVVRIAVGLGQIGGDAERIADN